MTPLDFRQAELIMAGRTSFINVGFAVAKFVLPKLEKGSNARKKAAKRLVFALTLIDIPRKATKGCPNDQGKLCKINDPTAHKQIQHQQAERSPKSYVIKTVGSVSTVHKLCHPHAKSTHIYLTSDKNDCKNQSCKILYPLF